MTGENNQVENTASVEGEPFEIALRKIPIFEGLSEDQLRWFASNAQDLRLKSGEILIHEGDPADALFVLLEGEIRGRRESAGPDAPVYVAHAGHVTGMLPFSRLTVFSIVSRAFGPARVARLHKDRFPEMLEKIPQLLPRLVYVLSDRIRDFTRADQQRDKLTALGKFSAGLAHELNNPASAARRAAESLRRCTQELRQANAKLDRVDLSAEQRAFLSNFEHQVIERLASAPKLDSLVESDLEEETVSWLERRGLAEASRLASGLVEAGLDIPTLELLAGKFGVSLLPDVLTRLSAAVSVERLTGEIEGSTGRISELVQAVKEYSYMDQSPEQQIDIHHGIESTLTMLKFRLKKGIRVTRDYDKTVPRIFAHGSELNQVWTNLIDNAIDAMNGTGELIVRTVRELDYVLVEIIDHGTGIPEDMKPHIFEPFFTTKGVGRGTGLGLDTVYRIVRGHHGQVTYNSKPGETRFQVRLPLQGMKGGPL